MSTLISALSKLSQETDKASTSAKKYGNETKTVQTPLEKLTDTIEKQQQELNQLQNYYADAVLEFGKGSNSAKRLASEIQNLNKDLQNNQKRLKDASYQVDDLGDEFKETGNQAATFGDILAGSFAGNVLSDALSGAIGMLQELAGGAAEATDSLTRFESTMKFAGFDTNVIKEAEAAVQTYADNTVYDLETVANTAAQLGANGVDNFEMLTEAAGNLNAVAGGNADTFRSVAMMLTQTVGAGKLTTENWNQLADAIPGASYVLQQAMLDAGAYTGNFREAMENGEISAEEFTDALMQLGMSEEAIEAAQNTDLLSNAIGNLQASIISIINDLLKNGGMQVITDGINTITVGFQQFGEWVSANKDQIIAFGQTAFNGIMAFGNFIIVNWEFIVSALAAIAGGLAAMKLSAFYNDVVKVINGVSSLSQTFPLLGNAISVLTNPVALVGAAIVGLVTLIALKGDEIQAILQKVDNFMQNIFAMDFTNIFGPVLGNILNGFMANVKNIFNSIMEVFNGVIDFIRGVFTGDWERAWNGVKEIFGGIFNGLVSLVKAPLNAIIGLVNGVIGGINSLIKGVNNIPGVSIPNIGTIPLLAKGGVVLNGSAIVGEAGPELLSVIGGKTVVQPLNGSGYAGESSLPPQSIEINVYAQPGQDVRELARLVGQELTHVQDRRAAVFAQA